MLSVEEARCEVVRCEASLAAAKAALELACGRRRSPWRFFEALGEDATSSVLGFLESCDLGSTSRADRRLYARAQASAALSVVGVQRRGSRVERGSRSFAAETAIARLRNKEAYLLRFGVALDCLFRDDPFGGDPFVADAARERELRECAVLAEVDPLLMVSSGRVREIWPVFDEREAASGRPRPLALGALALLSDLVQVAHWAKRDAIDAYLEGVGLLAPENHTRLVALTRLSLESDGWEEDWNLRYAVLELLGNATAHARVAAVAFDAFAEDMDTLVRALTCDSKCNPTIATLVSNLAHGPLSDRARVLTTAGCLQPLIDLFDAWPSSPDQASIGTALTSFSAHAPDSRAVADVFLRRENIRLLAATTAAKGDEALARNGTVNDAEKWRGHARDACAAVLADVRLAARLHASDDAVHDILAAADTPEAAACVTRHLAWCERNRFWHDGKMHYGNC